jgi:serine/threonine-protein kinase
MLYALPYASVLRNPLVIGRYAIYEAIAAGGMGTVHLARLIGPAGFSRTVADRDLPLPRLRP